MKTDNKFYDLDMDWLIRELGFQLNQVYFIETISPEDLAFFAVTEEDDNVVVFCQNKEMTSNGFKFLFQIGAIKEANKVVWISDTINQNYCRVFKWLNKSLVGKSFFLLPYVRLK